MLRKIVQIHLVILMVLVCTLCQCTKAVTLPPATLKKVEKKKKPINPYALPTASYLVRAQNEQGDEKQKMLLLAAGTLIKERQWQQAALILNKTNPSMDAQIVEKKILLAQISRIKDQPQTTLDLLMGIKEIEKEPLYFQKTYHQLLAESYKATSKNADAVVERIKLENLLEDSKSQHANRKALWLTLTSLSPTELETLSKQTTPAELQGWVELALISSNHSEGQALLASLEQWQARFSLHPANEMLPTPLASILNKMVAKPQKVALLLPLSGSLAGPGQAIKEGFMASYQSHKDKNTYQVAQYDTAKGEVSALYKQAIQEGADYVIGPLTKAQVNTVAAMENPVPTLLLNDSLVNAQEHSYIFGLSPLNEAIQIAIRAKAKGYNKALIIAPQNAWGEEISLAFKKHWEKNGGLVSDTLLYTANDDLNKKMQDFLHLNYSQDRQKQLKQLLGETLQTIPSRRQDFEFIFLLAYPSKARQIIPLLRYYYAGDMPVYATSSVYSGSANALKDKDLDGVIFCDIPWVFSHQMGTRNWPEQFNSYNRLYALGQESYALTTHLNQLILFSAESSQSTSSTLYLKSNQKIRQRLEWGQFKQGLVHSLGALT